MSLKIRVLGSGTSSGVPTIGCTCAVCKSSDPRDRRLRPSILVQHIAPPVRCRVPAVKNKPLAVAVRAIFGPSARIYRFDGFAVEVWM